MINWGHFPWHVMDKHKQIQCVGAKKFKSKGQGLVSLNVNMV
jgi:hypothetical protein